MSEENIKSLESLIQQYTGPSKKLIHSQVTKLTQPGENYVGVVYKVVGTLQSENGKEEIFNAVAKCLNFQVPDFIKKMMPPIYLKEKAFYTDIVPALQEFQQEMGLRGPLIEDLFPILYCTRKSLDEDSDEPDADAVLLFENLAEKGYSNADRTIGFDLDGAELILKDLALFHAVPIALKLKKPDEFENKIKKHLNRSLFSEDDLPPPPPKENVWIEVLKEYEELTPYLDKVEKKFKNDSWAEQMKKIPREPFASIRHSDLWTNNTMQIFSDGKPIKNKLIDFQMYFYDSIVKDLIFFLWSSVKLPVILEHFDDLIKLYHKSFVNILDNLSCDTTPFSYENLLKEIDEEAGKEFTHIITMLVPIFGKKGEAVFDISEGPVNLKKEQISDEAKNKAVQTVCQFGQRGWI